MSVITAVYEIHGGDAARRAEALAVEQSHELPTDLAPTEALVSLGRVVALEPASSEIAATDAATSDAATSDAATSDAATSEVARVTVEYPAALAGDELTQLLVLLIGNVSLQPGIRLVDVHLEPELAAAITGGAPRFGLDRVRRLTGARSRPLLATALKPVGLPPEALAAQASALAAGGLDLIKDDQGLANQRWAPFRERVAAVTAAVARANAEHGTRALYLPAVAGPGPAFAERVRLAVELGADGVLVLPGVSGFDRIAEAADILGPDRLVYAHPSLLGGFTASTTHGIAPDVLFGLLHRLARADSVIFPSTGGRFSFTPEQCRAIADACRRGFAGLPAILPSPGGGMSIDRVPELVDLYGRDVLLLIGADLHRGGDLRAAAERFRAAAESV